MRIIDKIELKEFAQRYAIAESLIESLEPTKKEKKLAELIEEAIEKWIYEQAEDKIKK